MNLLSILSFIVSTLAVIYTWVNGKKIHDLDLLIKEHEVKKNQIEEDEKMMASIECNVIESSGNEMNRIIFYNKGRNAAKNIDFDCIDDPNDSITFNVSENFLPYPKLLPQQSFSIYYIEYGNKPHYTFKITWDDDFSSNRSIEQIVDL
jgi:hypothetical protein